MAMIGPAGGGQARSVLEGLAELQANPEARKKLLADTEAYETARAAAAAAQEALAGAQAGVSVGQKAVERLRASFAEDKAKLAEEWEKLQRSRDAMDEVRKSTKLANETVQATVAEARKAHDALLRDAAAASRDLEKATEAREAAEALRDRWGRILGRFEALAAEAGGEGR